MVFEAQYSKARLAMLAILGLLFAAMGGWLLTQTAADLADGAGRKLQAIASLFNAETVTVAHILGWIVIVMGLAVLPVVWSNLRHTGPAIRIDQAGVYWHRWSDAVIPWSNIEALKPYSISGQKMVGVTLIDPDASQRTGLLSRLGKANNALGYGHLALSLQGTDGNYERLLETLMYHASTRH